MSARAGQAADEAALLVRLMARMNAAGVIWMFAIMLLICADILARNLLDSPIRGVPELVSLSLVAAVFLQLAHAIQHQRLTRAELLLGRLRQHTPAFALGWQGVTAGLAAAILLALAWGAWPDFLYAWRTDEFAGVEGQFTVLVWPVKAMLVGGAAVAALAYLRRLAILLVAESGRNGTRARHAALALLIPLGLLALTALLWSAVAEPRLVGLAMIACVLALIALGMPIAIALLLCGFLGLGVLRQDFTVALRTLALAAEGSISEYVFATVPLFVLMGLFVSVSDIGRDAFRAAQRLCGRIRGGLGVATVAANAVFAAITGISIASAAIFAKIAVPEMVRQGYSRRFALGLTAGSSVLGMLIPPSLLLIIYGVIAEVSIGDLFLAAVIPGILLAAAFALGVLLMARFAPGFVGQERREEGSAAAPTDDETEAEAGNPLWGLLAVAALVLLVLGGIYGGLFTPTEAGAAGALAAMLIALARRRLTWHKLWEVMGEAGQVSVTILFLIICASIFSRMLTLTELPADIAALLGAAGLGMAGFLAIYLVLLVVLGMVLDSTSILLILLPLALPVVSALGGDLVWFGIVTVIGVEIGLLTPPLGLSVYVIQSSLNDERASLGMIFSGAFPFVLITLAVTIVLMAFPSLSLMLL